ncbi:glycosyl hydrolase family 26 [Kribbella amoyensis]|uniref:Glycosyl hydrolase family 26 n=2 Tax=Kribbella amoyensis TaxID=996641 RepID=A0A561B3I5_9ACTN|nr:glycosyl hydrolase family 26 [Kribbella amoyensis]
MEFGARVATRGGETDQAAVQRMEQTAGHLDVVREFLSWDSAFPNSFHNWLKSTDHTLILSVKSKRANGASVLWANLVAAQPGSTLYNDMVRWADRIKAFEAPIYFAFNHEPESGASQALGTATDFIAAWRKIRGIFNDRGVTNAKFIWIMTDYSFFVGSQARNDAAKWYPGDAYLEAMGADAYNWHNCRTGISNPWKSLEQIIRPYRDFGAAHPDEELWLTEWASTEDPAVPGRKAQWIADAQALFKRPDYAQFRGVAYFDYPFSGSGNCNWLTNSSASALAAFGTMGNDEFYGGTVDPPDPPDPTAIEAVGIAGSNGNLVNHTVQIPGTVRAGDTLLLFFSSNQNPASTTGPAGWTQLRTADPTGMRSRVWTRTATATDAGTNVTVTNSVINKADLMVTAYRGISATQPVDVHAMTIQTVTTASHPAPSVTPTQGGDWVVVYWADKSSTNTGYTIPTTLTQRRTASGSSGGHITATLADTDAAVGIAPTGTFTATGATTSGTTIMYTIALRPAEQ